MLVAHVGAAVRRRSASVTAVASERAARRSARDAHARRSSVRLRPTRAARSSPASSSRSARASAHVAAASLPALPRPRGDDEAHGRRRRRRGRTRCSRPGPGVGRSWIPTSSDVSFASSGRSWRSVTRKLCPCSSWRTRRPESPPPTSLMLDVAGIITRAMATCGRQARRRSRRPCRPTRGAASETRSGAAPAETCRGACAPPSDLVDALVAHRGLRVERGEALGQRHAHVVGLPGRATEVVDRERLLDLDAVVADSRGDRRLADDERLPMSRVTG